MKSSRDGALAPKSAAIPGRIDLGPQASSILKNLERARNYGNKRKYNAELRKLCKAHPDFSDSIMSLYWR